MPGSHLFNLGLFQKNFCSTSRVSGSAINMGNTKGRGSTTRMFNYCNQRSPNPSLCINQFVTFSPSRCVPTVISLSSIATYQNIVGSLYAWVLNPGTTVSKCQTLNIPPGQIVINYLSSNTFTNNGTINVIGALGNYGSGLTFINNGTINAISQGQLGNLGFSGSNIFINNSHINYESGTGFNDGTSQFTNNGYITLNSSSFTNTTSSTFDNNGQIQLNNISSISNEGTAIFNNNNIIIDINGSYITNDLLTSSTFNNSGVIYDGTAGPCSAGTYTNLTQTGTINTACGP